MTPPPEPPSPSETGSFDRDTALEPLGSGRFRGEMSRRWFISRGPNGGYVAAVLLRAAQLVVDDPTRAPRSLSVHYTAPPEAGPVELHARIERSGRSLSNVCVRMRQGDRLLAIALAALSRARSSPALSSVRMPEVPPPERCPANTGDLHPVPIRARYEQRSVHAGEAGMAGGWIRLVEPRPLDALLAAALADAWTPSVFAWVPEQFRARGVPTVDLTVHFRAELPLPDARANDYQLALFRTRLVADGFLEEDGEIWSPDGTLVAQSRQLAAVL